MCTGEYNQNNVLFVALTRTTEPKNSENIGQVPKISEFLHQTSVCHSNVITCQILQYALRALPYLTKKRLLRSFQPDWRDRYGRVLRISTATWVQLLVS